MIFFIIVEAREKEAATEEAVIHIKVVQRVKNRNKNIRIN